MGERIGDIFLRKKIINNAELERALQEQVHSGEFLGEILVRLGFAKEEDVLRVLADQTHTKFVNLSEVRINPRIAEMVPKKLVTEFQIMPIEIRGEVLLIAMNNPLDIWPVSQLQEQLHLAEVHFVLARKQDIEAHTRKYYGI